MKNSYCNEKGNTERQVMTMYEIKLPDKQDMNEKTWVVTTHIVTLLLHHISMVALTPNKLHRKDTNKHTTMDRRKSFLLN